MSKRITFSYPTDKTSMNLEDELLTIKQEFGISTSRFVRQAVEEKILNTKKIKTTSLL